MVEMGNWVIVRLKPPLEPLLGFVHKQASLQITVQGEQMGENTVLRFFHKGGFGEKTDPNKLMYVNFFNTL